MALLRDYDARVRAWTYDGPRRYATPWSLEERGKRKEERGKRKTKLTDQARVAPHVARVERKPGRRKKESLGWHGVYASPIEGAKESEVKLAPRGSSAGTLGK